MKLLPSQIEFIEAVYGRVDADGRRQIRLAVKSEPRGNGKSGLLAGLSLAPESVERGQIFSAAVDRNQASILFDEMRAIILADEDLDSGSTSFVILKNWKSSMATARAAHMRL